MTEVSTQQPMMNPLALLDEQRKDSMTHHVAKLHGVWHVVVSKFVFLCSTEPIYSGARPTSIDPSHPKMVVDWLAQATGKNWHVCQVASKVGRVAVSAKCLGELWWVQNHRPVDSGPGEGSIFIAASCSCRRAFRCMFRMKQLINIIYGMTSPVEILLIVCQHRQRRDGTYKCERLRTCFEHPESFYWEAKQVEAMVKHLSYKINVEAPLLFWTSSCSPSKHRMWNASFEEQIAGCLPTRFCIGAKMSNTWMLTMKQNRITIKNVNKLFIN